MLFKWFKKKDKLIPLESADSGKNLVKAGKPLALGFKGKPFVRPAAMAGAKKPAQFTKNPAKINTSESSVIRIGKLGEVLLQYNMISRENLEKALEIQQQSFVPSGTQDNAVQTRKLLGEILIEHKFVTEEQLLSAFARHCRIPYIKLNKYGLPKAAIKSVPEDLIIKHKVMPVDKIGSMLMLAVTDPYDINAVEEVKTRTGLKVKTILCKQSEFAEMVKFYYPHINENQAETPADTSSETSAPDASAKQEPTQETHLGEETAVFNIEELPFPEPPAAQSEPVIQPTENKEIHPEQTESLTDSQPAEPAADNIQETPVSLEASVPEESPAVPDDKPAEIPEAEEQQTDPTPENITTEKINPSLQNENHEPIPQPADPMSMAEDKKEGFLDEAIEETNPDNLPAATDLPVAQPAISEQTETKPEPEPELSSQPLPAQESENPAQQPEETIGVNGDDTSLIDIQDLITAQQNSPDENIEIIPEEPEPADATPYIYPEMKEPKETVQMASQTPIELPPLENKNQPIGPEIIPEAKQEKEIPPEKVELAARAETISQNELPAEEKTQTQPIPTTLPDHSGKSEDKTFKENPVLVSEDEFLIAQQLFTAQLTPSWEKLYHRSKPSRAEKADESEFAFYTETATH